MRTLACTQKGALAKASLPFFTGLSSFHRFHPACSPRSFWTLSRGEPDDAGGFPMLSRRVGVQLEESALKHALHAQTPPTQEVSFGSGLVWRHPCFLDALAAEFVSPSCLAQQRSPRCS